MMANRVFSVLICVVLASIALPSTQASEPAPRRSVQQWWHQQALTFTKRHGSDAVAVPRQFNAPRFARPATPLRRSQPVAGPQRYQQPIRRVSRRVPKVPADQPPKAPSAAGIVRLNSPLYPAPRQNIPHQVGGVVITNPALAPHEMLYEHEYRALYPPFYYRVKGSWMWTPFGIESHDKWELVGTEVRVRYESEQGLIRRLGNIIVRPFFD
ncbi:MAG: hypothetical protein VB859_00915 [Planctomycetaceae bacterium]